MGDTRAALAAALLTLVAYAAAPLQAQERPLSLRVGITQGYDSNVFRLPDSAADPFAARGISGKSDWITTVTGGLRAQHRWSQQQLSFDLNATASRYRIFDTLDRETSGYLGGWNWVVTPRLRGTLTASRNESAVEQEDLQGARTLVIRTVTAQNATADATITGGWHLIGGLARSEQKHSQSFAVQPDSRQGTGELGARYEFGTGSSVSALRRNGSGTQQAASGFGVTAAQTGYAVRESELRALWVASARSTVSGRVTRTSRRHDNVPNRDFEGNAAELGWFWAPTGRLGLGLSAQRRLEPFLLATGATHRVENTFVLAPTWAIAPRLTARAALSRRVSAYAGDPTTARRDSARGMEVGLTWSPFRTVSFTASWRRDSRSSSDPQADYAGTIVVVGAQLSL